MTLVFGNMTPNVKIFSNPRLEEVEDEEVNSIDVMPDHDLEKMCCSREDGRRDHDGFMEGTIRGAAAKAKIGSPLESAIPGIRIKGASQRA